MKILDHYGDFKLIQRPCFIHSGIYYSYSSYDSSINENMGYYYTATANLDTAVVGFDTSLSS